MDQRKAGVKDAPRKLEHEVEALRDDMTRIVSELDRRGHELLDWRLQLHRHRGLVAIAVAAGVLALLTRAVTRRAGASRNRVV
jgi:hypothetical protein